MIWVAYLSPAGTTKQVAEIIDLYLRERLKFFNAPQETRFFV